MRVWSKGDNTKQVQFIPHHIKHIPSGLLQPCVYHWIKNRPNIYSWNIVWFTIVKFSQQSGFPKRLHLEIVKTKVFLELNLQNRFPSQSLKI